MLWWSFTERAGAGDLRPYLFLQTAPLILVPLWQAAARSARSERIAFGVVIALYVAAKAAELGDRAIFEALGFMSEHTAKHLLASWRGWSSPRHRAQTRGPAGRNLVAGLHDSSFNVKV